MARLVDPQCVRRGLRRRRFMGWAGGAAASVAMAGLAGCGGDDGGDSAEVIVIGAGIAGMRAAHKLQEANRSVLLLEARERPGGRIYSDYGFPVPFDYGAQLFQQCVPVGNDPTVTRNPLFNIARGQGVPVVSTAGVQGVVIGLDGQPLDATAFAEFVEGSLAMNAALDIAGAEAEAGIAADVSLRAATAPVDPIPYVGDARLGISGERGLPADAISALDLYNYAKWTTVPFGLPSDDNWLVRGGMGNFIVQFAADLHIEYGTEVLAIDRSGSGVVVYTTRGAFAARAVIITVSIGVLQSRRIDFLQPLPPAHVEAIAALRMGAVGKVGFAFDTDVFGGLTDTTAVIPLAPPGSDVYLSVFAKFFGQDMAVVIIGGLPAEEERLIALARETIARTFGAGALDHVTRTACHSWSNDRWAVGAYTTAQPGHAAARTELQQAVDGKLFLAGEALSVNAGASMHGAWIEGEAAAVRYLGRAS